MAQHFTVKDRQGLTIYGARARRQGGGPARPLPSSSFDCACTQQSQGEMTGTVGRCIGRTNQQKRA